MKQTLIPLKKWLNPSESVEKHASRCVIGGVWVRKIELCPVSPDRERDYVMSLDFIGVTRGVSVSPFMGAAWDWLSWLWHGLGLALRDKRCSPVDQNLAAYHLTMHRSRSTWLVCVLVAGVTREGLTT